MKIQPVNIAEKLSLFNDTWSPKIIGSLNGQHVKIAKLHGEFVWHKHDYEDELFLVIDGILKIELQDKIITLHSGEFAIIPKGTEHKPVAENEVSVLLFEPESTLNTGDIENDFTKKSLETL